MLYNAAQAHRLAGDRQRALELYRNYLRVYGRGDTLVMADASEAPPGEPLFVKLVEAGRIVYRESFEDQAARADRTWGRFKRWELSGKIRGYMERFQAMREREVAAARERLAKK